MPSLNDLARLFASLTTAEILVGLLITAAVVVLLADWRLSLLSLAVQYILVAVLLSTLIPLPIAVVRMIAGGLVATMFYITARRVHTPRDLTPTATDTPSADVFWVNLPFRLVALTFIGISVIAASGQFLLLNAPLLFWLAGLWLCASGLLVITLTRDALKLGMGLLFFTSGFGVIYLSLDNSLLIYALLTLSDLVIALAVSHIASVPIVGEGRRRGE